MPTLEAIETKVRRLQEQAEAMRAKKASATLDRIVALMKESDATVADIEAHIGGKKRGVKAGKKTAAGNATVAAKYMDPKTGATWSGRGRAPAWIASAKNRDRFLVDGNASKASLSTECKGPHEVPNRCWGVRVSSTNFSSNMLLRKMPRTDMVVLLDSYPRPASRATDPFVVANERQVALAYRIAPIDFERFGPFGDDDEPFCLLLFPWAAFHRLGPPNDEGLGAHPLAAAGLKWYSVHEIRDSSFATNQWNVMSQQPCRDAQRAPSVSAAHALLSATVRIARIATNTQSTSKAAT